MTPAVASTAPRHGTLEQLALNVGARIVSVQATPDAPEWAEWLSEIGFLPGEPVMLLARAWPAGDPLVVRVGDSTFALRRAEAMCVRVQRCAEDRP